MNGPESLPALPLSRQAERTLAEQLAERLPSASASACCRPARACPRCANARAATALSPSTVVAAYDRLLAAGLVEARRQRGFFVRETRPSTRAGLRQGGAGPRLPCR